MTALCCSMLPARELEATNLYFMNTSYSSYNEMGRIASPTSDVNARAVIGEDSCTPVLGVNVLVFGDS